MDQAAYHDPWVNGAWTRAERALDDPTHRGTYIRPAGLMSTQDRPRVDPSCSGQIRGMRSGRVR